MTKPIVPLIRDNHHTPPTRAEQAADRYAARVRKATPGLWALVRPYLLAAALAGAGVGLIAYRVMPIEATPVERVFADVNGDGAADLIVSGYVIFAPKDPALVQPGQ